MKESLFILGIGSIMGVMALATFRWWAKKAGVLFRENIAIIGGLSIGCVFSVVALFGATVLEVEQHRIPSLVCISLVMLFFGVLDDIREQSVVQKVLAQLFCVILLILLDIRTHIVYLEPWGNIVVTLLWVLGVTNAFNLLDVMDGLSAGVALIATVALLFLVGSLDPGVQVLLLGLSSALVGFLLFNLPPARIYLGNAGSHFLGFVLSAMTLMVSYAPVERPLALLSPVIILWLPLMEMLFLIYFRLKKKMVPFDKSDDHIALRFIAAGFSREKTLALLFGLAFIFACFGIALVYSNNRISWGVVVAVLLLSFGAFRFLRKIESHG